MIETEKPISGLASMFENVDFSEAWEAEKLDVEPIGNVIDEDKI